MTEITEADVTVTGNTTGVSALSGVTRSDFGVPKKKVLKPKMTAKERKERDVRLSISAKSIYHTDLLSRWKLKGSFRLFLWSSAAAIPYV